jgi:hypothetical protein
MLIVRVEIWPGGDPRALRQVALLSVTNVGQFADGWHLYEARHAGSTANLRHRQSDGPLVLVARAIAALAERSEPDGRAVDSDSPFGDASY